MLAIAPRGGRYRALSRFSGRARLRFPYLTRTIAQVEYQALASQQGWSAANLSVAPGIELMGLVRRPQAPNAPWVLDYPGNDATQLRRGQAFLSRLAAGQDWGRSAHRQHHPPASLSLLASENDIVVVRRSILERLDPGDDFQTEPFLRDVLAPVLIVRGTAGHRSQRTDRDGRGDQRSSQLRCRTRPIVESAHHPEGRRAKKRAPGRLMNLGVRTKGRCSKIGFLSYRRCS